MRPSAGVAPNVLTYTTLMSACTRHGQWQRALEAFSKMEAAGLQVQNRPRCQIRPTVKEFHFDLTARHAIDIGSPWPGCNQV